MRCTQPHTHTFLFEGEKDLGVIDFFFFLLLILLAYFRCNRNGGEKKRSDRLLLWRLFWLQVKRHILDRLKQELAAMEDSRKCPILKSCPSERSREQWQHPLFGVRVTVKATEGAVSLSVPYDCKPPPSLCFSPLSSASILRWPTISTSSSLIYDNERFTFQSLWCCIWMLE